MIKRRVGMGACVLAVGLVVGRSWALPTCDQITTAFCLPYSGCSRAIQWRGTCIDGDRQWRCFWGGSPTCSSYFGNWTDCCCTGSCGAGDGCDCLLAGTPVTMADGTTKAVELLRPGDVVRSYAMEFSSSQATKVIATFEPFPVDHYFLVNKTVGLTENHPVLSHGSWILASQLVVGSSLTGADGRDIPVFSFRRVDQSVLVYNIHVEAGVFLAGGFVVHNKEICEDYVQYCPTCGQ